LLRQLVWSVRTPSTNPDEFPSPQDLTAILRITEAMCQRALQLDPKSTTALAAQEKLKSLASRMKAILVPMGAAEAASHLDALDQRYAIEDEQQHRHAPPK
jgi:DNA polymerase III epsilon subunit-like protein